MAFLNGFSFIISYRLRVESMLLKAEFEADMSFLEPSIAAMINAGEGKQTTIPSFSFKLRIHIRMDKARKGIAEHKC